MDFDDARLLDQLAYDLITADYPRGLNRRQIADLANGVPPYSDDEVEDNNIAVNVNDLSLSRLLHDARASMNNAFLKPGQFFTCRTDMGSKHKRSTYGTIVSKEINKPMKRSVPYYESLRAKFGLLSMHGISPAVWENQDKWRPKPLGIEDVLIPSNTLLGFENLPFFILRRKFTGYELQKLTLAAKRDPGWNMDLVERLLTWADQQTTQMMGNSPWPDSWVPEKVGERIKEANGYYASDQVPTIDCFDVYGYDDSGDEAGWVRRIILDAWATPSMIGGAVKLDRNPKLREFESATAKDRKNSSNDFLFSSGTSKVAQSWRNLISFQFADLSAVAPFRYHSVRSLGFLLYSVCQIQNRMRCKFLEAVFETLMPYFRVDSADDVQRALKLELITRGFIDKSITPVPANERWQPNHQLIELGIRENQQLIQDHSSSWTQNQNFSRDRTEKTKFQVMAEVNAGTAMLSAALAQAYQYQGFEYYEIVRRFMKPNSSDPDVRTARANMLRQGVPEKLLVSEYWETEPERVMGAGNKTLELTIAQQLMEWRDKFDPQPQRQILRDTVLALTDDAARAEALVPEMPTISDSVHDSELAFGALMQGSKVTPKPGLNALEVATTIIGLMAQKVQAVMQAGGVGTPADVQGLTASAAYAGAFIQMLSADESEKQHVKQLGDALGKIGNLIKAMQQRQQEAAKKAQQAQASGNGSMDPKDKAKIQATMATAQAKMETAKQSHAQRTSQRQIQFQEKIKQDKEKHEADIAAKDLEAASTITRNRLTSLDSGGGNGDA